LARQRPVLMFFEDVHFLKLAGVLTDYASRPDTAGGGGLTRRAELSSARRRRAWW
jgi:hypothetical protein